MAKYSKSHEREEREKMGRGFWHSLIGLLFCWVPGLGLILSISGFVRQVVRMTSKYRVRLALCLISAIISLILCVAVFVAEVYQYSRNPDLPQEVLADVWETLTGQTELPWETSGSGGTDYTGSDQPGLGVLDGYNADDDSADPEGDGSVPDEYYTDDGGDTEPEGDSPDDVNPPLTENALPNISPRSADDPNAEPQSEGDSPDGV